MIITYANVFLFVLMSKKSVITLFEKSLSSPKSIPFRVEAPIISPYKFLIMNLLYNVLFRECHRITSRRLYFGVCILLPLFCLFFMATIFGNGQMVFKKNYQELLIKKVSMNLDWDERRNESTHEKGKGE